jgi:hypothetical protein
MSDIAVNPQTGEAVRWDGNAWAPVETARNPRTGAVVGFNGREWAPIPMPVPERSTGERVMRGIGITGQGFNNAIGSAVGFLPDLVGSGLRAVGLPSSEPGQYTRMAQQGLNALGRNDVPETATERNLMQVGEGMGGAASIMAPAAMVGQFAKAGGMAQKIGSALSSQPALQLASGAAGGSVTQATDNPWLGMAASLAVPAAVSIGRGLISPGAGVAMNPETKRLAGVAAAENIPLTPGQITDSRPLKTMESVFNTLPLTAGPQAKVVEAQRTAFNQAVLGKAGTSADLATPDVVRGTLDRAGGVIRDISNRTTMQLDPAGMQAVNDIAREVTKTYTPEVSKPIVSRIMQFIDKVDTKKMTVEGKQFAALDSALAAEASSATNGNVRRLIGDLRENLRGMMDRSISPRDAENWKIARRDYAIGSTIKDTMNRPNIPGTAGHISPAGLAAELASGPQANYAMGRGGLNDLARVGKAFVQESIPNSGTPERMAMQGLLTGSTMSGAMMSGANPGTTAALTALSLGLPRGVQALYNSPAGKAYLTNMLADRLIGKPTQGAVAGLTLAQAKSILEDKK